MKPDRRTDDLDHIRTAATDACAFIDGSRKEDLLADRRTQQAVIMRLIIVGEAAAKIMDEHPDFAAQHPTIPGRNMRGMRNRIAHGHGRFDINPEVVWDTVQLALPARLKALPDH